MAVTNNLSLWTWAQDQHLDWRFLQKPDEIIAGEPSPDLCGSWDDNSVEALLVQQVK